MSEPAPPHNGGPHHGGPLRVLVVDDEALGRQRLLDLLDGLTDIGEVRVAETGRAAVEAIRLDPPDVVFLDVQMPGMTGLDVVRTVGPERMPVTVFVTAYDRHALAAFDLAALDYLLKPFEDERFRQALDRARDAIHLRRVGALQARLGALLEAPPDPAPPPTRPAYLERVAVEMRGQVRVVPVAHIDYVSADGPYAEIHAGRDTFVIRERMQALEERLDPERFFRIHRSSIVQLDRIEALLTAPGGDYAVRLRTGERLKVSRTRRDALAERLGLDVRG
ncbi:MAG TPA: LytTR family DNA-binding domain-containing protein [Rhodothermales bacterium]|nr:LytTR family DNA-binding domain-containing protein [Rhodothermales bacterium]